MEIRTFIPVFFFFLGYTILAGLLIREYETKPADAPVDTVNILEQEIGDKVVEIFNSTVIGRKSGSNSSNASVNTILQQERQNYSDVIVPNPEVKWHYWDAIFYSLTVVTTIGYGRTSPTTKAGRLISSFYPIVGIPLLILTVSVIGEYMFELTDRRFESLTKKSRKTKKYRRYFLIAQALILSVIGSCIFFLLPSILFSYMEDWSYLDAYYFGFMTLTTVGLGDLAAGYRDDAPGWYKMFIFVWILLGMGWESMIITYLVNIFRTKASDIVDRATDGVTILKEAVTNTELTGCYGLLNCKLQRTLSVPDGYRFTNAVFSERSFTHVASGLHFKSVKRVMTLEPAAEHSTAFAGFILGNDFDSEFSEIREAQSRRNTLKPEEIVNEEGLVLLARNQSTDIADDTEVDNIVRRLITTFSV